MSKLVPLLEEPTPLKNAVDSLLQAGIPQSDANWLGEFFVRNISQLEQPTHVRYIGMFKKCYEEDLPRDVFLVWVFSRILGIGPGYFNNGFLGEDFQCWDMPDWAAEWLISNLNVNWAKGMLGVLEFAKIPETHQRFPFFPRKEFIMFFLSPKVFHGVIRRKLLEELLGNVSIDLIITTINENQWNSNTYEDPERLDFWVVRDLNGTLTSFYGRFATLPIEVVGHVALGIYRIIARFDETYRQHVAGLLHDRVELKNILYPYFKHIEFSLKLNPSDKYLQKALWLYLQPKHSFAYFGVLDGFEESERELYYLKEAHRLLVKAVPLFSKGEYFTLDKQFDIGYHNAILNYIRYTSGTWDGLKTLLLAISLSEKPTVAKDLRYWDWDDEGKEGVPDYPWRWIPEQIAVIIHRLKPDQLADPALKGLRDSFAEYCLSRLHTRKFVTGKATGQFVNEDFIEPRAIWREAYAMAMIELKSNPKGKGHQTLFWSSQNDPDEDVRIAAKDAYKIIRHNPTWPNDISPRRAIFGAFWWIRQCHLIHLGIKVDARGAQRTRSKEITWTTEQEKY